MAALILARKTTMEVGQKVIMVLTGNSHGVSGTITYVSKTFNSIRVDINGESHTMRWGKNTFPGYRSGKFWLAVYN